MMDANHIMEMQREAEEAAKSALPDEEDEEFK